MDLDIYKSNLSPKQRQLFSAVECSTLAEVKRHFEALSKAEWSDKYLDYLLLVTAFQRGHKSIIKFLMKNNCRTKIPMRTEIFYTPLYYAVELDDTSIIRDLVTMGASIFDKDKNERSPIDLVIQNRQTHIIDYMLSHFFFLSQHRSVDPTCETDVALFHLACWKGNTRVVGKFLECHFSVNSRSSFVEKEWIGFTPIHFALKGSSQSVVELLLEHDIDFHATDNKGKTPLLAAFNDRQHSKSFNRMLTKYVHDLDTRTFNNPADEHGLSHFHMICCGADGIDSAKHVGFIQYFINNGVKIDSCISMEAKKKAGYTALHFAAGNFRLNVVERLLINGADPKKKDANGRTPLHLICKDLDSKVQPERLAVAAILLKHGADVDVKDLQNSTPIHYAFYNRYRGYNENWTESDPLIKLLLSRSQLLTNLTDNQGISYLHIASCFDLLAVEKLLKHGASVHSCIHPDAEMKCGYSALHFAVSSNKLEIVEYLLNHGADPNIGIDSDEKVTPLHKLCHYDYSEFLDQFRNWIALSDKTDRKRFQMLSRTDRLHMLELLLEFGASANVQDCSGETPLFYVCEMATNLNIDNVFESQDQNTIFDEVCIRQRLMISILTRYGADINCRTDVFASLLHLVANQRARTQRKDLAEALLKKGADVNSVNDSKSTPLHAAVEEFLEHGFDDGLIDLLIDYGADINAKSLSMRTPLHAVMVNCNTEHVRSHDHARVAMILEKFLNYSSVDLDAPQDTCGNTLLHMAVRGKDHRCIKTLLDSGADISVENAEKLSPIAFFYETVKATPSALHSGVNLDCFIVLIAHVRKLMVFESYVKESVLKYYLKLSQLYPEKYAAIDSSIYSEVKLLQSKKIDHYTSLFSILSQDSNAMAKHVKNEVLKQIIESPALSLYYSLFSSRLIRQFKLGLERSSVLENAKGALSSVTNTNWPESCAENILKYLHNSDLRNIIKAKSIVTPLKRVRQATLSPDDPPTKLLRVS